MSSAKAGIATTAATSDEKNNLTASSLRCERLYGAAPCFARFGDLHPGDVPLGFGPGQIIGQSRTVALWHADPKFCPPRHGRARTRVNSSAATSPQQWIESLRCFPTRTAPALV